MSMDYYTDNVRGQIIGASLVSWRLLYDGKEVRRGLAPSDADAVNEAKVQRDELKAELNPLGFYKGQNWEVRIY